MKPVSKWSDLRDALATAGLCEEQQERVRQATAPRRHEERVMATLHAVLSYAVACSPMSDTARRIADANVEIFGRYPAAGAAMEWLETRLHPPIPGIVDTSNDSRFVMNRVTELARTLLEMDVGGIGGRRSSGGATDRMRWARGLGKARKQASDGGPWMAAAEKAMEHMRLMTTGSYDMCEAALDRLAHLDFAFGVLPDEDTPWIRAALERMSFDLGTTLAYRVESWPEQVPPIVDVLNRIAALERQIDRVEDDSEDGGPIMDADGYDDDVHATMAAVVMTPDGPHIEIVSRRGT